MPTRSPLPVPALAEVRAYRVPPPGPPTDLRLDGNEGAAPPAELLAGLTPQAARRYPDASGLIARLARRLAIDPARILITAGADEAIDRVCRAFLGPGRELLLPEPTFEMLPRYARLTGAQVVSVPWPEPGYPLDAVLSRITERTAVIAVVSPNNPTGDAADPEVLGRLAQAAPGALLLVDLAYGEFADVDLTSAALALPNAVVTRTFSKAWGLAGLRVGYALGDPAVIEALRVAGGPYPVSGLSLELAARRLDSGEAQLGEFVARVRRERGELEALLAGLGAEPRASQGNFVFARFRDARWVWNALAGLGIAVRAFPDNPALETGLRITCPGDEHDLARLRHGLSTALAPQALLFDLDGVLADVSGSYRAAILATAASYGVTLDPGEITAAKASGDANNDWELTRRLLAAHGVEASLAEVTGRFEERYQGTPEAPGLRRTERLLCSPEWLERLARRLPLAVVTGRPRRDAERFLEEHGVRSAFRAVVAMEDAPLKPDPAPVRRALAQLGVERAWLVGDTPDDVRAARAAGVVPVTVLPPGEADPGYADALIRSGAARVLDDLARLEGLLP